MLKDAEDRGNGKLKWYPSTVIKELEITPLPSNIGGSGGQQIQTAYAIQHRPAKNTPPLNTETLSQKIEDA